MGRKGKRKGKGQTVGPQKKSRISSVDVNGVEFLRSVIFLSEGNHGSAIAIENTCRDVLWGIVEVLSTVSNNRNDSTNEEIVDADAFSEENECIMPFEFSSRKVQQVQQKKKKKRSFMKYENLIPDSSLSSTTKALTLPIPPYSNTNILLEQNVYKISDTLEADHFVKVLGVGPSTKRMHTPTSEYVIAKSLNDISCPIKEYPRDPSVDFDFKFLSAIVYVHNGLSKL